MASRRVSTKVPILASLLVGFLVGRLSSSGSGRLLRVPSNDPILTIESTGRKDSSSSTFDTKQQQEQQQQRNFYEIAVKHGNDKASGPSSYQHCDGPTEHALCPKSRQEAVNPQCRIVGHFYHHLYQQWLGPLSYDTTDPFILLEIGFGQGKSLKVWEDFLPRAQRHTIDAACQNMEAVQPRFRALYEPEISRGRLHCGSSNDVDFLQTVYDKFIGNDGPPLKVVVEDASHVPDHMVTAVSFWLPRLEPGGLLFLEDIEPNSSQKHGGHGIQSDFLPQLISDIHYCGDPIHTEDPACFPNLQPLIQSIHCTLHICVIQRNQVPASNPSRQQSLPSPHSLNVNHCLGKIQYGRSFEHY